MKSCNEIREWISVYLDNELESNARLDFEKHIAECEECRNELAEMEFIVQACRDIPDEELPGSFKQQLHEKLLNVKQEGDSKKPSFLINKYVKICSSIAAGILLIVLIRGLWGGIYPHGNFESTNSADRAAEKFSQKAEAKQEAPAEMPKTQAYQDAKQESKSTESTPQKPETPAKQDAESKQSGKKADTAVAKEKSSRNGAGTVDPAQNDVKITESAPNSPGQETALQPKQAVILAGAQADKGGTESVSLSAGIDVKSKQPEMEIERIVGYAKTFGAVLYNDNAASSMMSLTAEAKKAPDTTADKDPQSGGAATVTIKIKNTQYDKFVETLKANYSTADLQVGALAAVNVNDELNALNKSLEDTNKKIKDIEGQKASSEPEELERLNNEVQNLQSEIDRIKSNENYTIVTFTITKKT